MVPDRRVRAVICWTSEDIGFCDSPAPATRPALTDDSGAVALITWAATTFRTRRLARKN